MEAVSPLHHHASDAGRTDERSGGHPNFLLPKSAKLVLTDAPSLGNQVQLLMAKYSNLNWDARPWSEPRPEMAGKMRKRPEAALKEPARLHLPKFLSVTANNLAKLPCIALFGDSNRKVARSFLGGMSE